MSQARNRDAVENEVRAEGKWDAEALKKLIALDGQVEEVVEKAVANL